MLVWETAHSGKAEKEGNYFLEQFCLSTRKTFPFHINNLLLILFSQLVGKCESHFIFQITQFICYLLHIAWTPWHQWERHRGSAAGHAPVCFLVLLHRNCKCSAQTFNLQKTALPFQFATFLLIFLRNLHLPFSR